MRVLSIILLAITAIAFLYSCGPNIYSKPVDQQYEKGWRETQENELRNISTTLARNNVKGCGQFYIREHIQQKKTYLVACTRDGKTWTYHEVFPDTGAVNLMNYDVVQPPVFE